MIFQDSESGVTPHKNQLKERNLGIGKYDYIKNFPFNFYFLNPSIGVFPGDANNLSNVESSSRNKIILDNPSAGKYLWDKDGHLPNTTVNRNLLESVANSQENYIGVDKYGSSWYAQTRSDGSQVWVQSRNGVITNGGVNSVPKIWDNETGLSLNLKDKQEVTYGIEFRRSLFSHVLYVR